MATQKDSRSRRGRFSVCVTFPIVLAAMIPIARASAESFIIRNARVFDGRRVISDADVWVEGSTIKQVGNQLTGAGDAKAVDGTGQTVLPGLIDAHTHTFGDALKDAIVFGVT